MKGYASIKTVAEFLDASEHTVENWVAQGLLPPPRKIGEKTRRWKLSEIEQWLDRSKNGPKLGSLADAVRRDLEANGTH